MAKTADGGQTWQIVPTPGIDYGQYPDPAATGVTGVRFVDSQHGYLFGDQLFVTSDGGATWQQQHVPGPIEDIEVASGAIYALVRDCPTASQCVADQTATARLYAISDGGRRFTPVGPLAPVSDPSQLFTYGDVVFLLVPATDTTSAGSSATLWVGALQGRWQQRSVPCDWSGADAGVMAAWSPTGLALVCGSEPGAGNQLKAAYSSTDTGSHWQQVAPLSDVGGYVASLAAADADTWILGEARGSIDVTHDGGRTWHYAAFTSGSATVEGWASVDFISATSAIATPWTLNGSALAITTDNADRWDTITFPSGR